MRLLYFSCFLLFVISCKNDVSSNQDIQDNKTDKIEQKKKGTKAPTRTGKESLGSSTKTVTVRSGDTKSPAKAKAKIDPRNVDLSLMERLIHEEINKVRKANKLSILNQDDVLRNAAVNQNNYLLTVKDLTHTQRTRGKQKLIDRVKFFGGGFQLLAENLIYEGFTVQKTNGKISDIITPTYREMAKQITINWMKSPGHRKNIVQKNLKLVGTAVAYNAKNHAIYATQVFGTRF